MYLTAPEVGLVGTWPTVGDCVSIATGAALAMKLAGDTEHCAVAWFGDAVPETGQFWESVNFAALHRLPLLYVCENNGYATQTNLSYRQPDNTLVDRVAPWDISCWQSRGVRADGMGEADALRRNLPGLALFNTYRFLEHVGPNDDRDMGYRKGAEIDAAREVDPLPRVRLLCDPGAADDIDAEVAGLVAGLDARYAVLSG